MYTKKSLHIIEHYEFLTLDLSLSEPKYLYWTGRNNFYSNQAKSIIEKFNVQRKTYDNSQYVYLNVCGCKIFKNKT